MDMEFISGLMGQVMLANIRMGILMDKEPIVGQMEISTKANGRIIRWMDMEKWIGRIKENI